MERSCSPDDDAEEWEDGTAFLGEVVEDYDEWIEFKAYIAEEWSDSSCQVDDH